MTSLRSVSSRQRIALGEATAAATATCYCYLLLLLLLLLPALLLLLLRSAAHVTSHYRQTTDDVLRTTILG